MSGEAQYNAVYTVDTYNQTIHTTAHSVRAAASDVDHVGAVLYSTAPQGVDGYNAALTGDIAATLGVNCGMSSGRNGVLVHNSTSCAEARGVDGHNTIAYGFPLGFRPENTRVYEETATTVCNGTRPGFTVGVVRRVDLGEE